MLNEQPVRAAGRGADHARGPGIAFAASGDAGHEAVATVGAAARLEREGLHDAPPGTGRYALRAGAGGHEQGSSQGEDRNRDSNGADTRRSPPER